MWEQSVIFWILQAVIVLFALSLGRSILILKIRKEENRKRELELSIYEKKTEIINKGKKIAHDLEEVLYKAKVLQEIDKIIRKDE